MALRGLIRYFADSARQRLRFGRGSPLTGTASLVPERPWEMTPSEQAAYHEFAARKIPADDLVDERVWADLEMPKVFGRLDRSATPAGSQYLLAQLKSYQTNPAALAANVHAWKTFQQSPEAGRKLREALRGFSQQSGARAAEFLFDAGTDTSPPPMSRWFRVLSTAAMACSLGVVLNRWLFFPLLGIWLINLMLHWHYGPSIGRHAPALRSVALMLSCVPAICRMVPEMDLPESSELRALLGTATRLRGRISKIFLRQFATNEVVSILTDYLNLLCLVELNSTCRALRALHGEREALLKIFEALARLDAYQGLALALADCPAICVAETITGRLFELTEVYHPLVENAVRNSLTGQGNSFLLSGANMAGKTTFMKAVAINLLLAQTLGLVLARKARLPAVRLRTLIKRDDSISGGHSYFFDEACELQRMIHQAEQSSTASWFFIDEIFRGTNSRERVAAGEALLRYLNARWLVFASTHDQELAGYLEHEFVSYYFSEVISGDQASFDYRLCQGFATHGNAIKLLKMAGFPKSVTDEADQLAQKAAAHTKG